MNPRPRTRRLFPDIFRTLKRAHAAGIPAAEVWWFAISEGCNDSYLRPSERAAALGIYFEYLEEIYGKDATRGLVELGRTAIGGKPS
jgi:hypothetical protein